MTCSKLGTVGIPMRATPLIVLILTVKQTVNWARMSPIVSRAKVNRLREALKRIVHDR